MQGFTHEEVFLTKLCNKSFLRFWCWPNLYRDQGDSSRDGDGKEICDLTVVFGNNILLFSDKKIAFNSEIDIKVAWSRWARKAIKESVQQIKGARRWIERYPNRIFIDKNCKNTIPIEIPDPSKIKFHNIVVCHGIENILRKYNDEASFIFDNKICGDDHWNSSNPFSIGQIFEGGFVHIFNEETIQLVLNEFDTVKDFLHYLEKREDFLSSEKHIRLSSESDIIQLYLINFDHEKGERNIWTDELRNATSIVINLGGINKLYQRPEFIAKKEVDLVSYFWDRLIDNFSLHILNRTAIYTSYENPIEAEPSIRFLASSDRFERRMLAEAFIDFYHKVPPGDRGTRVIPSSSANEIAYLFVILPFTKDYDSLENYRKIRQKMLHDYCAIHKFKNSDITNIIGIACKTRDYETSIDSYFFEEGQDLVLFYGDDWDQTDYMEAGEIFESYKANKLFGNQTGFMQTNYEFPKQSHGFRTTNEIKGRNRNLPCLCGSGKKIKKCCARHIF